MKILINCDGGSRGNPGPAAIGVVLWDEEHNKLEGVGEYIGETTNNVAEYKSLIKALKLAAKHGAEEVQVFMDSELVVRQVNGEYRVKKEHLRPLYERVQSLLKEFKSVRFSSLPREDVYQQEADRLVNEALDRR